MTRGEKVMLLGIAVAALGVAVMFGGSAMDTAPPEAHELLSWIGGLSVLAGSFIAIGAGVAAIHAGFEGD